MLGNNKSMLPNEWFTLNVKYTEEVYYKYRLQHGAKWRMYAEKALQGKLQSPSG
jgi:hypothetical protein